MVSPAHNRRPPFLAVVTIGDLVNTAQGHEGCSKFWRKTEEIGLVINRIIKGDPVSQRIRSCAMRSIRIPQKPLDHVGNDRARKRCLLTGQG